MEFQTSLTDTAHGQTVIDTTSATTYLLYSGASAPDDDPNNGDDIVEFDPLTADITSNLFDSKFAAVKAGDIITINYGSFSSDFIIKETKATVSSSKRFIVRIDGKNLLATSSATAKITRSLSNSDKEGVLALSNAQSQSVVGGQLPSLTVSQPRGAQVIGNGFNATLINSTNYNLYLQLFPTGNPSDYTVSLPVIDITGNAGASPGAYTLNGIVAAINLAFRQPYYNYRFVAFAYKGELGIMLADHYNNTSFSVISGILSSSGAYDAGSTTSAYPNNAVDVINGLDCIGYGPATGNIASPPYASSYSTPDAAQTPTKIFRPLTRKTFFVNGTESDKLATSIGQSLDTYGDGYWSATLTGTIPVSGRLKTVYTIGQNLSTSSLMIGKTIVVLPEGTPQSYVDYGRFIIEDVEFNSNSTTITVFDAIHGTAVSTNGTAATGTVLRIYFNGDSVGFNQQNASSTVISSNSDFFKRNFEVLLTASGFAFSNERARLNISGSTIVADSVNLLSSTNLSKFNIVDISPKLGGYLFGNVNKITFHLVSIDAASGIYTGYLCNFDGTTITHAGPTASGKQGTTTRFYDESYVDYIDISVDISDTLSTTTTPENIDIQLFKTLRLDNDLMFLGTCQVNNITKSINYINDRREFGNTSEKQLSTSALKYISANDRVIVENGIIRGFDIVSAPPFVSSTTVNTIKFSGGTAFINGQIVNVKPSSVNIPFVLETIPGFSANPTTTMTWFVCVNDVGNLILVASTDYYISSSGAYGTYDESRLFYVYDPLNGVGTPSNEYYNVRSSYLADIVKNQKDIVVIAEFTAPVIVSGSTVSFNGPVVYDMRRYIDSGNSGLNGTFTLGNSGNFRNLAVFSQWSIQLNDRISSLNTRNELANKLIVKGAVDINSSTTLTSSKQIVIEGGTFNVNVLHAFTLGTNITFRNVDFNINLDGANLLVDSTNNATILMGDTTGNITIENCRFNTGRTINGTTYVGNNLIIGCRLTSQTAGMSNIIIRNNSFYNANAGVSNKTASIAFITDLASNDGSSLGPTASNITIEGNTFNKDNMILVSSTIDGSNVVQDAIVASNFKISRNVCGSINFLTRNSLGNVLTISDNTCKFIYTGYADGNLYTSGGLSSPYQLAAINHGTGDVVISDNATSWIQVGNTSTGTNICNLVIRNNIIIANDPTFLTTYYNGNTVSNAGIVILPQYAYEALV
jgi:hypothetical protein